MTTSRPYQSSLRAQQAADTKSRILEAAMELLQEDGGLTNSSVAERAGVAPRTVQFHFPNRDALHEAVAAELDARVQGTTVPSTMDGVVNWAPELFAGFEANEELIRAILATRAGQDVRRRSRARRASSIDQAFAELDGVPEDAVRRARALVETLVSGTTWMRLKDFGGMSSQEAGAVAAWAVRTIVEQMLADPSGLAEIES